MKPLFLLLVMFAGLQISSSAQVQTKGGEQKTGEAVMISGHFLSNRGVMTENSCYGFNIGELRSAQDQSTIAIICFDKLPNGSDLNINCEDQLLVTGYYETKDIDGGGPCRAGSKKIFYVETWECVK